MQNKAGFLTTNRCEFVLMLDLNPLLAYFLFAVGGGGEQAS